MKEFIVFFVFLYVTLATQAQDCHCSVSINSNLTFFDGATAKINPGDTICLMKGQWRNIKMRNIVGTQEKPITIINCGGQALVGNNDFYYALVIENSRYFKLTGTGDTNFKYGIRITGTQKGSGVSIHSLSTDFEVENIEVSNTGFAGIVLKTDPTCDSKTWRENFTMKNISIHDNYVHDTGGEGMYIGNTKLHGMTRTCDNEKKKVLAHFIEHLRVYNNIIENTAWDGMQISMAHNDCSIYGNIITNFGVAKKGAQDNGMVIGGGTTGRVYNNTIKSGVGSGIALFGLGENYIFNNLIFNPGVDGIFIQDNKTVNPGWGFHIIHNDIINPGRDGIRMYSDESKGNEFVNNIIINPGSFDQYEKFISVTGKDSYIYVLKDRKIDFSESNNYFERDITKVGFVDPAHFDFRLQKDSPAIDTGKDFTKYGITTDYYGMIRNLGKGPDIGISEFLRKD